MPADGPVSWTDREDSAEAAAVVLASDCAYDRPITLTATTAPTFDNVAAIASEVSGRRIQLAVLDHAEWLAGQVAAGQKEVMARFTLGMYQAARDGLLLGHPPRPRTAHRARPARAHDPLLTAPNSPER